MTAAVVGRVMLSDPATMLHGAVGPVMVELHADGSVSWRPIYQSKKGRRFAQKDEAEPDVQKARTLIDGLEEDFNNFQAVRRLKAVGKALAEEQAAEVTT